MTLARLPHPDYLPAAAESASSWVALVQPAADLAGQIAGTEFVPTEMRNKPAAITACILYGAEIGIGPMMSLAKIDIVKGRPAPRAELARALALAAGHEVWVDEQTNTKCKVSGRRRGSQQIQTVTWTLDDVKKAGISSPTYAKYPRQMLLARASAELVRMMAPDVLGGISLFAEEAADNDVEPAPPAAEPLIKATTRRRTAPTTATPALAPTAAPAAPVNAEQPLLPDEEPAAPTTAEGPTDAQIRKMMASFNDLGIKDRDDRLTFIAAAVRPVESSKDLTVAETATVIDQLDAIIAGTTGMTWNDDGSITLTANDSEAN